MIAERDRLRGPAHPLEADEGLAGIATTELRTVIDLIP